MSNYNKTLCRDGLVAVALALVMMALAGLVATHPVIGGCAFLAAVALWAADSIDIAEDEQG